MGGAAKQKSFLEPFLNDCTTTSETFAGGDPGQQTTGVHRFSAFWLRQRSPPFGGKFLPVVALICYRCLGGYSFHSWCKAYQLILVVVNLAQIGIHCFRELSNCTLW